MIELMKESERVNNLGPETVGHLIPLSIGHTDRPTEYESKYINNILTKCEFTGIPPDNTQNDMTRDMYDMLPTHFLPTQPISRVPSVLKHL